MEKNRSRPRILVALSGGVDSAVAAWLLRETADVVGATMVLRPAGASPPDRPARGCRDYGSAADLEGVGRLAARLGIPLRAVDCSREYGELVLAPFRAGYLAGRTPNPCVLCNPALKFGVLFRKALLPGESFDFFATGHYARVGYDPGRRAHFLARAVDAARDQSYFLYRLAPEQLARACFPLGGLTKSETRALARGAGLDIHDRPASQDFYAGDHADLLGVAARPGEIVDADGRVLGRHPGYWHFTPGQRRGLRLPARGPRSVPLYTLSVDAESNRVVVGTREATRRGDCRVGDWMLSAEPPEPGEPLLGRIRSAQPLREMAVAGEEDGGVRRVVFASPQEGVAPGQSLVLYRGERVAGGGVIVS